MAGNAVTRRHALSGMLPVTRSAQVYRLPMDGPDDVAAIQKLFTEGTVDPKTVVAILGKTEGNGCVNDFTRGYATQSLRRLLEACLSDDEVEAIPLVMSGGTEGGLSPHWIVLSEVEVSGNHSSPAVLPVVLPNRGQSLAIACSITRALAPAEIGRSTQSELVRDAVLTAMSNADISSASDVHLVQIKCPLLTSEQIAADDSNVATTSTLKSMGLSRGASALGVALAPGEIDTVTDVQIGNDLDVWSSRASCSSGIELMCCEVVVLGQSDQWTGPLRIGHGVMEDAIDASSVMTLLSCGTAWSVDNVQKEQGIIATIAKAEASSNGIIRGNRHTMLQDSDISATRHARAFVGGLLAGILGTTELFVSGGAEHQGPDGGGPFAIIYKN